MKPKYYGTVTRAQHLKCYCKQNKGAVWLWEPRVSGLNMSMPAHTKCFRSLWKGEN